MRLSWVVRGSMQVGRGAVSMAEPVCMAALCVCALAGTGSAVVAEELSSGLLDFSYQFVGRTFSKDVTVYNMGRKPVLLTWASNRQGAHWVVMGDTLRGAGQAARGWHNSRGGQ